MQRLTLGSLFDGIGGWQLAARHAGIEPVWSSEIEAYPMAVTAKHFPATQQLGDITKIDVNKLKPVDIICAGSPCQDLSVAGGRKGLDGERSGLFKTATAIVHAMRRKTKGKFPRFFIWENVPGAFSSNGGNDFRAVLEAIGETEISMPNKSGKWANSGLVQLPKCEIAWRLIDAQYFGVPQRRKRIFLVADFGKSKHCAKEILFERTSLSGNTAPSGESGQRTTDGVKDSAISTGKFWDGGNICSTLTAHNAGGNQHMPDKNNFTAVLAEKSYSIGNGQVTNLRMLEEKASTLDCMHDKLALMIPKDNTVYDPCHRSDAIRTYSDGMIPTMSARWGTGGNNIPLRIESKYNIRRLTPIEAERLQGLPDNYTLLEDRRCSDSARYKALGNGMAQPCADFVLRRLMEAVKNEG